MQKNIIVYIVIGAIIIGGLGFYGGTVYERNSLAKMSNGSFVGGNRQFTNAMGQRGGARGLGGLVSGEVLSKDSQSIVVKLRDGSGSKIVFVPSSVMITKMASGTPSDLKVGDSIVVSGATNSDGSINAQTIQLRSGGQ